MTPFCLQRSEEKQLGPGSGKGVRCRDSGPPGPREWRRPALRPSGAGGAAGAQRRSRHRGSDRQLREGAPDVPAPPRPPRAPWRPQLDTRHTLSPFPPESEHLHGRGRVLGEPVFHGTGQKKVTLSTEGTSFRVFRDKGITELLVKSPPGTTSLLLRALLPMTSAGISLMLC